MQTVGTFWALIPPMITIILGLITKKVNLSLIIGISTGAILFNGFSPLTSIKTIFDVMSIEVAENIGVIFFVILLGMFVHLLNLSGASQKYGEWAKRKLKTKKASLLATFFLGILIFVDDYFNCLTVGTVMMPVTDRHHVSREKLAYIIDSTAAPICMIAPISSWAAAVSSSLPNDSSINGFQLFIKCIAGNFYSLLTLVMVFLLIILNLDFGKMRQYEMEAQFRIDEGKDSSTKSTGNGKVVDLILPVIALIVLCVFSMLFTGDIMEGASVSSAFADCDAIMGLCMGTFLSVLFIMILYIPRRIVSFSQYMDSLVEGFKAMIPSILILCFAWTLGGICGENYLNAGGFISTFVSKNNVSLTLMPMFFFIVAVLLSFSTGTSWGTFAILIPMEVGVFGGAESALMIITTAAVLGGSVAGDHLSPISDTTILSSTGAQCNHLSHVQSQAYYGSIVIAISFLGYAVSGLTGTNISGLAVSFVVLVGLLAGIKISQEKK